MAEQQTTDPYVAANRASREAFEAENKPMPGAVPRLFFVAVASRIAQKAGGWAADAAFFPGEEAPGEMMQPGSALRFCAEIEGMLTFIRERANG